MTLDFDDAGATTVAGIVGGDVTVTGVEEVRIDGQDSATANDFDVLNYGAATDVLRVVLNGGDAGNNDGDTVDVSLRTGTTETLNSSLTVNRTITCSESPKVWRSRFVSSTTGLPEGYRDAPSVRSSRLGSSDPRAIVSRRVDTRASRG